MSTLSQQNKELREKVAQLEVALGRATVQLMDSKTQEIRMGEAGEECKEAFARLTVHNPSEAIEFYVDALGVTEVFRVEDEDRRVAHAVLRHGDSMFVINAEYPDLGKVSPKALGGSPVSISFKVTDAESALQKALDAGCQQVTPLERSLWGDINCLITDPFGHSWTLTQPVEQLSADEIIERVQKASKSSESAKEKSCV